MSGSVLREVVRALCVLGVLFLNFAHVPTPVAAGFDGGDPAMVFCGDPVADDAPLTHAPCHACRLGAGALLPAPAPAIAAPLRAPLRISLAPATGLHPHIADWLPAPPRGPPAVLCPPAIPSFKARRPGWQPHGVIR